MLQQEEGGAGGEGGEGGAGEEFRARSINNNNKDLGRPGDSVYFRDPARTEGLSAIPSRTSRPERAEGPAVPLPGNGRCAAQRAPGEPRAPPRPAPWDL